MAIEKTCFVIRPIGEPDSDIRKEADERYYHLVKPVCEGCGYEKIIHAGEISAPGLITRDIVEHVINSSLLIADLTGSNANVFYELSLRHALRKPYVCLSRYGEKLPFDTHDCRTIWYHAPGGFAEHEQVRRELKQAIVGAEEIGSNIQSPISVSLDILQLGQGGSLERAANATRLNTEKIIKMLGDTDAPVRFKVCEILEKMRRGYECISEEYVMCAQHEPVLSGDRVLTWLRAIEHYMQEAPKRVLDELQGICVATLRDLAQRDIEAAGTQR